MTMALYELAYRHDIQEKLRIEIEEVVSRHDGIISYDAISEMTYLDQVINGMTESLAHFRISMTFICCFRNFTSIFTNWTIIQDLCCRL